MSTAAKVQKAPKDKSQKNNLLIITGIFALLDLLLFLIPLIVDGAMDFSTVFRWSHMRAGMNAIVFSLLPHFGTVLVFQLALLLLTISGFSKNTVLCCIGLMLYGLNFTFWRMSHRVADQYLNSDYMRMEHGHIFRTIGKSLQMIVRRDYLPFISFGAVLFFSIAIILTVVVVIMRSMGSGKTIRVIAIVLAVLAVLIFFFATIGDIAHLNRIYGRMLGLGGERMPYIAIAFRSIGRLGHAMQVGNVTVRYDLAPLTYMVNDVLTGFLFAVTALTSAFTMPKKK